PIKIAPKRPRKLRLLGEFILGFVVDID
ncbi:MAG: hypothetical protein FD167_4779, partial [bacterium]